MIIKIKRLTENAVIPTKATDGAAAYDVYAPLTILVKSGRQVIDLGFAIELPKGYEAKIEPRSGYSSKGFAGVIDYTSDIEMRFDCDVIQGKIDSDYRASVGVILCNRDGNFYIRKGQRIAQLTIYKVENAEFVPGELSDTDRGQGGFGHTGI